MSEHPLFYLFRCQITSVFFEEIIHHYAIQRIAHATLKAIPLSNGRGIGALERASNSDNPNVTANILQRRVFVRPVNIGIFIADRGRHPAIS